MNGRTVSQKPTIVQIIAVVAAGVSAWILAFSMMWCAMWKVYVDPLLLMGISNILSGITSAITTILVGRTISQLNKDDDDEVVEIPTDQPKPKDEPPDRNNRKRKHS